MMIFLGTLSQVLTHFRLPVMYRANLLRKGLFRTFT